MTSLIHAGKDLLNVFPVPGMFFGVGYGAGSLINSFGYLQTTSPLWCATAAGSIALVDSLADFTTRRITRLNWISQLGDERLKVTKEYLKTRYALMSNDKGSPKYNKAKTHLDELWKKFTEIQDQFAARDYIITIAALAITYFSQDAALNIVNSALTSAVTYLPSSALTICSSLSITPTGLIVSTIFATASLVAAYQFRQLPPVSKDL